MSYSLLSKERRIEFEGKNYKKLLKFVYYYGKPANGRSEYFALDYPALEWIRRTIYWNLSTNIVLDKKDSFDSLKRFKPGVLLLDYFILQWEISFYIEKNHCWFIGNVLMNENTILMKTKKFNVKIVYAEGIDTEIYELCAVKFKGPAPGIKTITHCGDDTYFLHIKWDNSFSKNLDVPQCYKKINVDNYKMLIENRAVILPESF